IGKIGDGYIVVSETCALDLIDAEYVRDIEPGEIVLFNQEGIHSFMPFEKAKKRAKKCIFEYIYFARPDSHLFGRDVYPIRKGFGKQLANEFPVDADVVIPIPDSGVPAAIGYAEESGIPYELGLIRNHYVGRTFIEPVSEIRHFGVKLKLNPVREVLEGKRVIVVDDSIVRGTTSMKIVKMLRKAGAKEVHMRVSSPPTIGPCYYGIDTPDKKELTAANHSIEEIRKFIDADSLSYLSRDDLYWFEDEKNKDEYCDACFTENYPIMPKVR
ncbi:MAG: amidophosphoribosyltransferase, partial [Deltaproteobacteria bacterium CG_4_10_14_0_2_um_filter_43_8]